MADQWLSRDELISLCASAGYAVTPRQLERWRKADLLPRPRREHLGKGKGTRSRYPEGTAPQLLALCELHFSGGPGRRLDELGVALWLKGFSIPLAPLKRSLIALVEPLKTDWEAIKGKGSDRFDVAEKVARLIANAQVRRGTSLAQVRRHLPDARDIQSCFTYLFQLLQGEVPLFAGSGLEAEHGERTPGEILELGLGLEAARTVPVAGAPPWLTGAKGEGLGVLKVLKEVQPARLEKSFEQATEGALLQAREDWQMLTGLVRIARVLKLVTGADVFGAALLAPLVLDVQPPLRVVVLGYLLALRRKRERGERIDQLAPVIREQPAVYEQMERLLLQNPALAECFGPLLTGPPLEQAARQQLIDRIQQMLRGTTNQAAE